MPQQTPKLNYEIVPDKSPLYTTVDQLNQSTAGFTVAAENSTSKPVTIRSILVELKKVVNGRDSVQLLLPGGEGGIQFPGSFIGPGGSAWSVTGGDGQFTFKPDKGSAIFKPGDKISVVLTNVVIREGGTGTALANVFEQTDQATAQTEVGIGITQSTLDVQLSADNTLIAADQTVTLKWATNDASSGVLTLPGSSPDKVPLNSTNLASGQQRVTPLENTTFSLTCQGRGPAVTRQVTISIQEVQIINFYSSKGEFSAADTIDLYWQTQYASNCSIRTKEGSGTVTVPVENNETASCKVSASYNGSQLILSKTDGSAEFGRIALPIPCPSSITFLLEADGSPNPKQATWVISLLLVQLTNLTQQIYSNTTTRTVYPPPPRWVDPNADPPEPYTVTTTTYMIQLTWNVGNAGSVLVSCNGGQVSTASIGSWQSGYDYGSPPSGTITCQGFGGPVGH